MHMKMLIIMFRATLESQLLEVLKKQGVEAYSEMYNVHGMGETGRVSENYGWTDWPGTNSMFIVVLPEDRAENLVAEIKQLRGGGENDPHRPKLPLRLFVQDCVQHI
jgi:nitrogen regulatory protein PII